MGPLSILNCYTKLHLKKDKYLCNNKIPLRTDLCNKIAHTSPPIKIENVKCLILSTQTNLYHPNNQ